jgi:hypothetical protein
MREIKSRITMARAALLKEKKLLFTRMTGLKLRKKTLKWYIWSITLWGPENLQLRKVDRQYLESFEMKCWRR